MNKIAKRAWAAMILAIILFVGLSTIVVRYFRDSQQWYLHHSNNDVYTAGKLNCGMVYDRSGTLLLDANDGNTYPEDEELRRATVHLLGDVEGNIPDYMMEHYSDELTAFDLFNGAQSGKDVAVKLTINAQIQKAALAALEGKKGTVGVYNYQTGEMLCMVSTPGFDPMNPSEVDGSEAYDGAYVNRFLHATYTPGSVFKLLTAAAAIGELQDLDSRVFQCNGSTVIGGEQVNCNAVHGEITFDQALTKSCNVTFARLALELGAETLEKYVMETNIEGQLSFDGFRTREGKIELEDLSEGSLAWVGVGQHTNQINPCQFMTFVGAIANGGSAAKPYFVEQILCGEQQTYGVQPSAPEAMLSPHVARRLAQSMHTAVIENYGEWNFAGIYAGGKSGTAERDGGQTANALFAGFLQDPHYPLAYVVVVEGGGSGSETCLPIVKQVLDACVTVLSME